MSFALSAQCAVPTCNQFPAAVMDQDIDAPDATYAADPELTFFKDVMMFRGDTIQHTFDDAIKFFNESYGLASPFHLQMSTMSIFYQNAKLSPSEIADNAVNLVTLNNWIQTGNNRSNCYKVSDRGFQATFSAEQTLYGSYGGNDGKTVGVTDSVALH